MNELYIFLPLNFSALNFTSLPFSKSKSFLNDPNLISLKIAYKVCSSSNSVPNEISDIKDPSSKTKYPQFSGICILIFPCGDHTQLYSGKNFPSTFFLKYLSFIKSNSQLTLEKFILHTVPALTSFSM